MKINLDSSAKCDTIRAAMELVPPCGPNTVTFKEATVSDDIIAIIWKPIPQYEGWYSASSAGHIRRDHRGKATHVGKLLSPTRHPTGYTLVRLSRNEPKRTLWRVHRLIALTFLGPCQPGYEVNHKNGIKGDNRLCNLEYMTPKQNIVHARDVLGTFPTGARASNAKLSIGIVRDIRARLAMERPSKIARDLGIHLCTICDIAHGRTWGRCH